MRVTGPGGTEIITVAQQFADGSSGVGVEAIEFGDGTVWTLNDIVANTKTQGGNGGNIFIGTDYNDHINAGGGNDIIEGGIGHDWLNGGTGNDTLTGGDGVDQFVFSDNFDNDTIIDFENNTDLIRVEIAGVSYDDLVITSKGAADAEIEIAGHGTITLKDVDPAILTEADFTFV